MLRALSVAALALLVLSASADAADAPARPPMVQQAQPQQQSANGVIVQAIQPTQTGSFEKAVTSHLWIYDTNTKQVMLCSSLLPAEFTCSRAVKLNW
ncbi:hypothetical protein [Azospirillum argentinense]|uniref:Uncharacterized protein n=1 Tax=Azospirillum brasilense TaxID=192 RepID=A0A4D8QE88_AZOBR|nr:hypothetical protein [Azospirillum argentinense]QCO07551.1 hypothetical protein D3867_37340 [Azospirillum argentinense]